MISIKVRNKDVLFRKLRMLAPEIEKELAPALQQSAEEIAEKARNWAPRSSGVGSLPGGRHYADSINAKRVTEVAASRFGFRVPEGEKAVVKPELAWGVFAYWTWRFIEFGTIASTKGERVVNKSGRARKAARTHPGTPAKPHILPAYRMFKRRIAGRISRAMNKAIKKVAGK